MADSYMAPGSNGGFAEKTFVVTSAGAGDSGKGIALNSSGQVDSSALPGAYTANAFEGITGPAPVNIFDSGGTDKIRNADNTTSGKECNGFSAASVTTGNPVTVLMNRGTVVSGFTGLTDGGWCYLGASGAITQTAPAQGSGDVWQPVGKAISTTQIVIDIKDFVQR